MPTRTFSGRYKNLAKIADFVSGIAQDAGFDTAQVYSLQLAVDEACTNIIEHGYGGEGRGKIVCACDLSANGLTITLKDWGRKFDPEEVPKPNYNVPLEKLQKRGAGLYLMNKIMDRVHYQFDDKKGNQLTMFKKK
jgi:serine/threonine-protein kinase RsbW